MVAGAHHVGQRQQRCHKRIVLTDRQHDQRAVGLRDTYRLALAAVDIAPAIAAAVKTLARQALAAEHTGAVRPEKRREHQVAGA